MQRSGPLACAWRCALAEMMWDVCVLLCPCNLLKLTARFSQMRTVLYGKKAANLYTQAFVQNTQARALYQESEDTYYRANDAASYDDWRRARHQWDYFYNRH